MLYLRAGVENLQVQLPAIDGQSLMVQRICQSQEHTTQ